MGQTRPRTLAAAAIATVAFLAGLLPCLLTVGPALFADGPMSERLVVLAIGTVVMFAFGALGGAIAPHWYRLIGLSLAAPTVPIVAFFVISGELAVDFLLLGVAFIVAYVAAALLGAWSVARLRESRRRRSAASQSRV